MHLSSKPGNGPDLNQHSLAFYATLSPLPVSPAPKNGLFNAFLDSNITDVVVSNVLGAD